MALSDFLQTKTSGLTLVYDSETTGLADFKARSNDPAQPHLVQLALILYDAAGVETASDCVIIRPDGWTIPPETTALHGITQERAMDEGIPETYAAFLFLKAQSQATIRVAHNEQFDRRILRIAMTRAGIEREMIEFIEKRRSYCTMQVATPMVNLPPTEKMLAHNITAPKSASLAEAYKYFFEEEITGAHDALVDARACARIYWRLINGAV